MKFEIKNWLTGGILFSIETETDSWKLAVEAAVKAKADLNYADLSSADLSSSDLGYANLRSADLRSANLGYANLRSANLGYADLRYADLRSANLRSANLNYADLSSANLNSSDLGYANLRSANLNSSDLRSADLSYADLRSANLGYANLRSANLGYANLSSADLSSSDLSEIKNGELALARTLIVSEGPIFGWKKCREGVIVKLFIPSKAARSNAADRKCRAERAKVLEVIGGEKGISLHDVNTVYEAGKWVRCDKWNSNRWEECGGGIHFYITRLEAEAHS